jgi:hypothetical protein
MRSSRESLSFRRSLQTTMSGERQSAHTPHSQAERSRSSAVNFGFAAGLTAILISSGQSLRDKVRRECLDCLLQLQSEVHFVAEARGARFCSAKCHNGPSGMAEMLVRGV